MSLPFLLLDSSYSFVDLILVALFHIETTERKRSGNNLR
jgi:hypothetical protein